MAKIVRRSVQLSRKNSEWFAQSTVKRVDIKKFDGDTKVEEKKGIQEVSVSIDKNKDQ